MRCSRFEFLDKGWVVGERLDGSKHRQGLTRSEVALFELGKCAAEVGSNYIQWDMFIGARCGKLFFGRVKPDLLYRDSLLKYAEQPFNLRGFFTNGVDDGLHQRVFAVYNVA